MLPKGVIKRKKKRGFDWEGMRIFNKKINRRLKSKFKIPRSLGVYHDTPIRGEHPVNDKREYYRTEYLKSEHWFALRREKLKLNPVCEKCGSPSRVEPHHLVYRNLYDTTVKDLKTLCRKCHILAHQEFEDLEEEIKNFEEEIKNARQALKMRK